MKYSLKVNKHSTLNFKNLIFNAFVFMFVFQDWIQNNILSIFQYFDELVVLIGAVWIIVSIILNGKIRVDKDYLKMFVSFGLFVVLIVLSTLINQIQNFVASVSDLFLLCKFFIALFIGVNLRKYYAEDEIKRNLLCDAKIITILLAIMTIASFFIDGFTFDQKLLFIKSICLCYSHPLFVCAATVFMLAIFMLDDKKSNSVWIVINLIICAMTLKAKAYAAVVLYIALYILLKYRINKKAIALIILLGVFLVGYEQINYYFFEITDSARRMILIKSFSVARDYFPFGAGLATYGSYQSGVYYSPLYSMYDLDTVYGLSQSYTGFISDNFWPMIIGESGFVGTICYGLFLYYLFKVIKKIDKKNVRYAVMFVFFYLLIASTNEAAFVHYYSIPMAIFIGIFIPNHFKTLTR